MGRLLVVAMAAVAAVAVLILIAPFLLLGAIVLVLLAWRWPKAVSRVSDSHRLSRMPAPARATPMRFAGTIAVIALLLTGVSAALAGSRDTADPAAREATPDEAASPSASPTPTERPTPSPTLRPTPKPTPTITPSPTPVPTPVFGEEPTGATQVATVLEVVDGDTIDVSIGGAVYAVRYIGMDSPEIHSGIQWMGPEAADANASLVAGREVVLETDVRETDDFGRLLRYVWLADGAGWLLVNAELIRLGYAGVATYPPDVKYADALFVPAQQEAQANGLGLWGIPPTPVPTPVPVAPVPFVPAPAAPPVGACDASYPDVCIPPYPPDLDCGEIAFRQFAVVPPDLHGFDGDFDGIGCES